MKSYNNQENVGTRRFERLKTLRIAGEKPRLLIDFCWLFALFSREVKERERL